MKDKSFVTDNIQKDKDTLKRITQEKKGEENEVSKQEEFLKRIIKHGNNSNR